MHLRYQNSKSLVTVGSPSPLAWFVFDRPSLPTFLSCQNNKADERHLATIALSKQSNSDTLIKFRFILAWTRFRLVLGSLDSVSGGSVSGQSWLIGTYAGLTKKKL